MQSHNRISGRALDILKGAGLDVAAAEGFSDRTGAYRTCTLVGTPPQTPGAKV